MASVTRRNTQPASTVQIGAWDCLRRLGSGRWSDVHLARPISCGADWPADYALKVARLSDRDFATRLMAREAQVAAQISHPHVVSVLSMDLDCEPPYLVMPFVGSYSLEEIIPHGPANLPQSLWITRQLAEGLAAIHLAGWIHADIQPANAIVSPQGHATIVDLGLARSPGDEGLTTSIVTGRLPYIAPEMFRSTLSAQPTSDVYSLGVVFFELLTAHKPFSIVRQSDWVEAHLQQRPFDARAFVPDLHRDIAELINAMLAKEPLRRPSAADLVQRLTKLEIEHLGR